jgi:hypothetical protein
MVFGNWNCNLYSSMQAKSYCMLNLKIIDEFTLITLYHANDLIYLCGQDSILLIGD